METKTFPVHYPDEIVRLMMALSMTNGKALQIVGSASLRGVLYAGDYDVFEQVHARSFEELASALQSVVKRTRSVPNTTIVEIKCGEIPDWDVFRKTARIEGNQLVDFQIPESQSKLDTLRQQNIISSTEYKEASALLQKATTLDGFLEAKKQIRFHILRWTMGDVLRGHLRYRKEIISLSDALQTGGLVKIDTITLVDNRFIEVSMLYELFVKGERISGPPLQLVQSLQEDILYYNKRNAFKALKRLFSLSRATKNLREVERLLPILNSDLGLLNRLNGDIDTLVDILKQHRITKKQIVNSLRDFQQRLGDLYQYNELVRQEPNFVGILNSILQTASNRHRVLKLEAFSKNLSQIIHKSTLKLLKQQLK